VNPAFLLAFWAFSAVMTADQSPERVRIVAMGDSTTAGTPAFSSPLESPPRGSGDATSQYAYWLMQAHPEWEVLNRGVNGERSDQIRARFDRDVLSVRPAVVVLVAGVNDVYQGRPASHVIEQLRWMYDKARQSGIGVVAGTILPYDTATPDQNARMQQINAWIRQQAAADPALGFVDTRTAVGAPANPDKLSESADHLHPSPAGYRAMAEAIRPVIERILR
jgi:lysophospholipase L1-like esterase